MRFRVVENGLRIEMAVEMRLQRGWRQPTIRPTRVMIFSGYMGGTYYLGSRSQFPVPSTWMQFLCDVEGFLGRIGGSGGVVTRVRSSRCGVPDPTVGLSKLVSGERD
jgi:hypothetical protein